MGVLTEGEEVDGLETVEFADYVGYIVFLEKKDRGDAGGSGFQTCGDIVEAGILFWQA